MWNGYSSTRAYATTREWLVGSTFSGCSTTGTAVLCNFDRDRVRFYVAYTDDGSAASIPAPSGVSLVTSLDGSSAGAGAQIAISGSPVRLS